MRAEQVVREVGEGSGEGGGKSVIDGRGNEVKAR